MLLDRNIKLDTLHSLAVQGNLKITLVHSLCGFSKTSERKMLSNWWWRFLYSLFYMNAGAAPCVKGSLTLMHMPLLCPKTGKSTQDL